MRILIVGDIAQDRFLTLNPSDVGLQCDLHSTECKICFAYAEKISVKEVVEDLGGNAANVATGTARLGATVTIASQCGDDEAGRQAVERLAQEGIDIDRLDMRDGTLTNFSVIITYRGERTVFSYHNPQPYELDLTGEFDLIYLTSMGEGYQAVYEEVLRNHQDTKIVFQPGTIQLKAGLTRLKPYLTKTSLILVNQTEAKRLTGKEGTPRELLDFVLDTGAKEVVITDGKRGAYVTDGKNYYAVGVLPGIVSKEATGVGDAFSSAYIMAREEYPLEEAVKLATINAGSVIQFTGAQKGLLTRSKLNRLYREVQSTMTIKPL